MTDNYFGELYGELYGQHLLKSDRSRREADFAARVLNLGGARVLDLAAGFGRHARILARDNEVWALDRNADYLRTAGHGLRGTAARNLNVALADMRIVPLTDARFDAAILLFNSFGYFVPSGESRNQTTTQPMWKLPRVYYDRQIVARDFGERKDHETSPARSLNAPGGHPADENMAVLRELARVLKRGGGLLLELPNRIPLLAAVQRAPKRRVSTADYEIEEEFSFDLLTRVLSNRTRFSIGSREEHGSYQLRLYDKPDICAMLRSAGFVIKKVYGDYDGNGYSPSRSEMILIHGKRK